MRPVSSRFLQSSSSFGRASHSPHVCVRENGGGERVREKRSLTREFVLLVLSPFVSSTLSFFLLLSLFPLSRDSLLVSFVPYAAVSFSFFVDLFLLRSPRCYRSRVSPRSRSFSSSPSAEELLSRWFSYSALSFFFSSFRPLTLPRVAPFPSEFTPERVILPLSHAASAVLYPPPSSPPFRVLFCPCRSWCSALFEFKRGSHRCLVSPS